MNQLIISIIFEDLTEAAISYLKGLKVYALFNPKANQGLWSTVIRWKVVNPNFEIFDRDYPIHANTRRMGFRLQVRE